MGPRADFVCLSRKCQQDGAATTYEDLPIATTRCPVCGSKRIKRVWTPPHVARGVAKHVDNAVEPEWERHHALKESARRGEAHTREIEDRIDHEAPLIPYHDRELLAARDAVLEQRLRVHAMPVGRAAQQHLGLQASGTAAVPGLSAGSPIGPPVPTLSQQTRIVGRDTVDP